ncbi:LysE family translocator [Leeia sp. TBRC 13508]|uniref:LysE family translocator n=1 Tax=Leeia speluncae TaxID=2884804 RepID=A0ABS8D9D3_9NEIS|nr:LysE family translocator [Leeia speluncae]MCB6184633.1 LysE family translocator [Leeia speluncae]
MDTQTLFLLASTCLLGAMTPGLSLAMIVKHASNGGKRRGLYAAIGHATGILLNTLAALTGVAVLIKSSPVLYQGLTYLGCAYLLVSGSHMLIKEISKLKIPTANHPITKQAATPSGMHPLWDGLTIGTINPPLMLFFLSIFSQFVSVKDSLATSIQLAIVPFVVDLAWFSLVVVLLTKLQGNPQGNCKRILLMLIGVIQIVIGLRTLALN